MRTKLSTRLFGLWFWGSLVLLCSTSSLAAAQGKAAPGEAERAGKEGERLLAQHQAPQAVDALQRAYRLSQNVKYLLPLGMAYAEAERPLDALDALGRFLKEAPSLPDLKRREIGGKLQVMLDQVAAVVTVEASRQSAPVKIDGRPIGTTPIEAPLRMMPGKHEFVLQPAPTDPSSGAKVIVDLKPGERRTVKLEPGARSKFLEPQAQGPEAGAEPDEPGRVAPRQPQPVVARAEAGEAERPFYKKWWFWTGAGAVVVLAVGLGAGLGARSAGGSAMGGAAAPDRSIPDAPTWPGGVIDARGGALLSAAWGRP